MGGSTLLVMDATDRVGLLERAYHLFNDRQADLLLDLMTEDVEWPDVANGAVCGAKTRSGLAGPRSSPLSTRMSPPTEFIEVGHDVVAVVDQAVLDLGGKPLLPRSTVFHRYSFAGGHVHRIMAFTDRDQAVAAA